MACDCCDHFMNVADEKNSLQAPTIVFGADVNHPGAGNVSKPSIAAVVASMDRWVSRHGSCVAVQEHRKEVIQVRRMESPVLDGEGDCARA